MARRPDDEQLEVILLAQLETSMQLKNTIALYENDIMHGILQRSYTEMMKMVRRFLENKLLNKNRNARNEDQGGSRYGAAAFKGKGKGRGKGKKAKAAKENILLMPLQAIVKIRYTKVLALNKILVHGYIERKSKVQEKANKGKRQRQER